ncbi:MAG TPA: hypothetical protein VFA75_19660, partial [Nevskia sp.]|nr:hypothetical protein [Nevskia sp.]
MRVQIGAGVVGSVFLLAACGGNYSGAPLSGGGAGNSSGGNTTGQSFGNVQDFFAARVEPNLSFCRTCHVPGGVADTPGTGPATQGNLFLLSANSSDDYARVQAAWTALGKGVDGNKLLTNPSDPAQNHTGGQPWPTTSQAYGAMKVVLGCWDNPA